MRRDGRSSRVVGRRSWWSGGRRAAAIIIPTLGGSRKKRGGKDRKRIEKSTYVETKTVQSPTGPRDVKLFARGGQIGLTELTDTGEVTFQPLQRLRTHRTRSQAGTNRWYNDYRLPADHGGGGVVTVRLHGNDAESINRHLDDTLWLRRAHSIGHLHQTLNLLTYALGINALAVHLHRQRHAPPAAA